MVYYITPKRSHECMCDESIRKIKSFGEDLHLYICNKCGLKFFSVKLIELKDTKEINNREDDCLKGIW